MEIIEEDDEEVKRLMLRISKKEITLCDSCDTFFDYIPQKIYCDKCKKAYMREYAQRPENKAKARERTQSPEYKAKKREYDQRPEVKAKMREYYQRNKKLREEE